MFHPARSSRADISRSTFLLPALVLFGINLRTLLLVIPPLLPRIQRQLGLSYTATGLLNALPILIMGTMAVPAALVIGRIGAQWAVRISLVLMLIAAVLRGLVASTPMLYVMTIAISLAITLGQTTSPMIVREWFPRRIGQTTALYSIGLMIGEILAAALTVPLILPLVAGQWRGALLLWSLPEVLALALWIIAFPLTRGAAQTGAHPRPLAPPTTTPLRPRDVLLASLALGGGSMLFFGMDTWIPVYAHAIGATNGPLTLTVLTIAQLPPSLALATWGQHLAGKRIGFVLAGSVATLALLGWFILPPYWFPVLAGMIGASSASIFILGLSLPALLAHGAGVARMSGTMLGVGYTLAFIGPFIGGALWDSTHIALTAFFPILLSAVLVIVSGALLPLRHD